jgi:hypothetical protein
MDSSLFVRAALVQALLVAALFAVLIALPLGEDFFEDYGWISGPVAWIACAAGAARILSLPVRRALVAAAAGGAAGAIAGITLDHTIGLVAAVVIFGVSCGYNLGGAASDRAARA